MKNERRRLKKALGRVEVFALAFGTMIGWGWIMFPAQWIKDAGFLGAIIAFLVGGFMCIMVGLTYAELTSAFPLAGGELAFSYRGMGYVGSWITGWTISFAYIGVAAWEGIALSTAFNYLIPQSKIGYLWNIAGFDVYISWSIIGIIGAIVLTLLNITGVKPAAVFQILMVMIMLIIGIIYIFGSIAFGKAENITPAITSINGIGLALLITPSMYIGFDMVSKSAEEMNMPLNAIGKVLIFSIVAACIWYILMIVGAALCAPPELRSQALIPTADFASYAFASPVMGKMIIIGGICGIITTWNGFIVAASRIIFAMGRAKMLPSFFGFVHPKYQTPTIAIIFVGLICCISPLLGKNALIWLVDSASLGTVLAYLLIAVSFLRIRKKEPLLRRQYIIKKGRIVGIVAVIIVVFFIFWYTPMSPSTLKWPHAWSLILSWFAVGMLLLFSSSAKKGNKVSKVERELLIFGEEYA
ncbi:MAG: amino acid permease, partial [Anaerovoracaceae bacterium]